MELPKHITVLPADIRYRTDLTPFARALYSEILYHELERGYCSISNATFAEWYNCTKDTVSRTISELVNAELIAIAYSLQVIISNDDLYSHFDKYLQMPSDKVEKALEELKMNCFLQFDLTFDGKRIITTK